MPQPELSHKPHVVMTGPLPPAIGGMATFIANLAQSNLIQYVHLELFNTGKTTPIDRPSWQGIIARLRLLRRWWTLLNSYPTIIVHIHTCSGLTYFLDGMLLALARVRRHPAVLHIHGGSFDGFLDSLPTLLRAIALIIARIADWVVVLSEEWYMKLASKLPGASLYVIHSGIPPISLAKDYDHAGKRVRLLFLGGLCQRKGVLDLVRSLQGLPDHVHLSLAGPEEEAGFIQQIQEQTNRLELNQRVELLGPVDGNTKIECFGQADIFVLPSYVEGLPIALLEAMSAGLPVIATRVGGIPAVIEDGKHGLLVEPGNIESLRAAIRELAADAKQRRTLGQAAQQRWRERFSIDFTVAELLQLYELLSIACPGSQDQAAGRKELSSEFKKS